jgi:hypothetical protein
MPVLSSSWQHTIKKPSKSDVTSQAPARGLTNDDKYFQRKAREGRTDLPTDPNEATIDARSAAMDKAVQESRTSVSSDVNGYSYNANVRNDSGKTVKIIFWEYRFTEIARPANVVRRQFLCSVNLKKGDTGDLPVFSLLGPSETIDAASLDRSTEKLFDEKVVVNRIEFSDGTMRQRGNWKYEDVERSVERVTAIPWGKEICRVL